ncbi:hypothetical protein M408DRAFT_331983 [Serendipita vermifera MAFF 305830]|uniref:Uncharacterized protein n=1 Tax=Serendipita vermifera MAFF 305830 TaxID=933852 RepID=A0A0C3AHD7_SERVB|nr:hypothetical protein M408DRAFT_331983 [Serendipita vermifera MAFF 305830]
MPPKKAAPLPAKEAALFKTLLAQYEARQLKKAIKTADQILKKAGTHGETISMKGLVLTYQGKREEGLELVKKGVALDLSSHICWHVYGLVHKQEKNYGEALKCYSQALKFDATNMNILRDAATLQAQLRMFDTLEQTRLTILKLRMSLRQNWVALAVAYALNSNWAACQKLLEEFLVLAKSVPPYDPEFSELLLFYITALERNEQYQTALDKLVQAVESNQIVDRMRTSIIHPRLLKKLGRVEDATAYYKKLIARNPDCYESYQAYFEHLGLSLEGSSAEDAEKIISELETFAAEFPRALVPQRIILTVTKGEHFERVAKKYIHRALKKNLPSLFVDLKPLYKDQEKCQTIQTIVEDYKTELEAAQGSTGEDAESPTTYVWTLYYLGLHYSAIKDFVRANELLETAISHTPTLPELVMAKARNLKRAGDYVGAVASMDAARELDGQDRFLNTKCATYHLKAGDVEGAQNLLGMFTKKDAATPAKDLEDMQSFKFLLEDGVANMRNNHLAIALKRFISIDGIFLDMHEDQYDFHSYCIRRFTLNIYLDIIHWDDELRWNPIYIKAVVNACKIYLRLFDEPGLAAAQTAPVPKADEKKSKKQVKKERIKAAEEARRASLLDKEGDETNREKKDDDPDGHKAISVEDPIEQAAKLLQPFTARNHQNVDIWIMTYDVAIRRKKYLQALRALESVRAIDASHPQLHYRLIDLQVIVSTSDQDATSMEMTLLKEGIAKLAPGEQSPAAQNSQYLQANGSNADAILAAARASHRLGASTAEIEETAHLLLQQDVSVDHSLGLEALSLLEEIKSERASEFREGCRTKMPLSTVFLTAEQLAELRKEKQEANAATEAGQKAENGDALVIEPSGEQA